AEWLGVCVNDVHLRAARQVLAFCPRCGEPLRLGDVGPDTWCDDHGRCNHGSHDHQHGCGEINPPVEVTIDLADAAAELHTAIETEIDDLRQTCELTADEVQAITRQ